MAFGGKWAPLCPIALVGILLASRTTEALVLHGQHSSSLDTPQLLARTEQAVTLHPYTGNGAVPVAKPWNLLGIHVPIHYTPTESNITFRLTMKDNKARNVNPPVIYNLTVMALADIATLTVKNNGTESFPRSGQNPTFATFYPPSNFHFMMTASDYLPLYSVTDVLRGMQELTHYLFFLELAFEVFSDSSLTGPPMANGCLASRCGSPIEEVQLRNLEYVNSSAASNSPVSSRRLQSSISPLQLTTVDTLEAVSVTYDELKDPLPIYEENFADVATRMLADITNLIIANKGDGLLPVSRSSNHRILRYVDTWGSNLEISLLPSGLPGVNFTLGQAAWALKTTQDNLSNRPMVESRLEIMVGVSMVGWGCLSYANASAWRCIMPSPETTSSVGSRMETSFRTLVAEVLTGR